MKCIREPRKEYQFLTIEINGRKVRFKAPLRVGDDRYEIDGVLSVAGGFGIIYTARDLRLDGHRVLIKSRRYDEEPGLFSYRRDNSRQSKIETLRNKMQFEAACLKMFKTNRESRMPILNDVVFGASPALYGPHTDNEGEQFYITDDYIFDEPYIIMQMINGTSLGEYIRKGIPAVCRERGYHSFYEWERAVLSYAKELTTIFAGFHKPQHDGTGDYYYIYQDLKPDNIILSHDRFLTLLDFGGITKIKLKTRTGPGGEKESYTETGIGSPGLGTFGFQAPEARNSALLRSLDQRCDIYTLGATLFQLLTGCDYTLILETEDSEIPLEKMLKGVCSDSTFALLKKCLERDRDKRYSSMNEVKADIVMKCFKDVKTKIWTRR